MAGIAAYKKNTISINLSQKVTQSFPKCLKKGAFPVFIRVHAVYGKVRLVFWHHHFPHTCPRSS
jgi:hypothetical protein